VVHIRPQDFTFGYSAQPGHCPGARGGGGDGFRACFSGIPRLAGTAAGTLQRPADCGSLRQTARSGYLEVFRASDI
jgi:hypothetical protein